MAKGNPNDATKLLNFVAKVYDPKARAWKPVYELPDATNQVHGGVYLSDAVNETSNAATGVVAATPKAVKTANDNANNKLDKTTGATQNVASAVTFAGKVTGSAGFQGNLTGNVTGNASSATKLQIARNISVKAGAKGTEGTASFDGTGNISIVIPTVDATAVTGVLPLASIPAAATERIITVANQTARFALTTSQVQLGDTVYQADTKIMYMVVDEAKLNQEAGYQEYQAGTASKLGTTTVGSTSKGIYLNAGVATPMSATVGAANRPVYMNAGTITQGAHTIDKDVPANAKFTDTTYTFFDAQGLEPTAGYPGLICGLSDNDLTRGTKFLCGDGTWKVAGEVTGVKGDKESTYRKGQVNITAANVGALPLTGGTVSGAIGPNVDNSLSLGSSTMKWSDVYATTFHGTVTDAINASTADTANKINKSIKLNGPISSNEVSLNVSGNAVINTILGAQVVNTNNIADNAITPQQITNKAIQSSKIADGAVGSGHIQDGSIVNSKIANGSITNSKLASDVGTVYVGSNEPTQSNVKLWVKI